MANFCCSSVTGAIINNNIEELRKLIDKRKRVDIQDNLGWTPLHVAVKRNNEEATKILLKHNEIQVNTRNFEGCTSLYIACSSGNINLKIVKSLLRNGADPNIGDNENVAAVHLACKALNLELLKLLLQYGADKNAQDFNNYTPLHYSIEHRSRELTQYLLENGADTSLTECNNLTPLMFSIIFPDSYADLILPYTRNINQRANDGASALSLAINRRNMELVNKLIDMGADVNSSGPKGPLYCIVSWGSISAFFYLWQKIDYRWVSRDPNFIMHVCEQWKVHEQKLNFMFIFNTIWVDLHLTNRSGVFERLFNSPPTDLEESDEEDCTEVIRSFLIWEIALSVKDLEAFTLYFKDYEFGGRLSEMVIKMAMPNITEALLLQAIGPEPSLFLTYLSYCPKVAPERLFQYVLTRYENCEYCVGHLLALFTPSAEHKTDLIRVASERNNPRFVDVLRTEFGVKSLRELARDAVRLSIKNVCNDTKQFIHVLNHLAVPVEVLDIIRYETILNKIVQL